MDPVADRDGACSRLCPELPCHIMLAVMATQTKTITSNTSHPEDRLLSHHIVVPPFVHQERLLTATPWQQGDLMGTGRLVVRSGLDSRR